MASSILYFLLLIFNFVSLESKNLTKPYPVGSGRWCFDNTRCPIGECCIPVKESDGPFGRGVAPPGRCFAKSAELEAIMIREIFEGTCERLGHHGSDCYPNDHKNGTNGKPDGLVLSCPCNTPFTCSNIDLVDHHGSLGVCI